LTSAVWTVLPHSANGVHAAGASPLAGIDALGVKAHLARRAVVIGRALRNGIRRHGRWHNVQLTLAVGVPVVPAAAFTFNAVVLDNAVGADAAEARAGILALEVLAHEVSGAFRVLFALGSARVAKVTFFADADSRVLVAGRSAVGVRLARVRFTWVDVAFFWVASDEGVSCVAIFAPALLALALDVAGGVEAANALSAKHDDRLNRKCAALEIKST
jgi:hypothetical protein